MLRSSVTRRGKIGSAIGLGALALVGLAFLSTPSVEACCDHLGELAEIAGETPDPATRELCRQRLEQRRRQGRLRWLERSWCLRRARSIPDAGAC